MAVAVSVLMIGKGCFKTFNILPLKCVNFVLGVVRKTKFKKPYYDFSKIAD